VSRSCQTWEQRLARPSPRLMHKTPVTQRALVPFTLSRARMGLINSEPDQVRPEPRVPMNAVRADEDVDTGSIVCEGEV
jgi:hypothetical protein